MDLSNDLVSKFVEITNDSNDKKDGSTAYGTTVEYGGKIYVKLDGSDLLTPVETTSVIKPDERVSVLIKDHSALVTGNLTTPSASSADVAVIDQRTTNNAIINTVTQVVPTRDELDDTYAQKSEITQTADAIRSEVSGIYAEKSMVTQTANEIRYEFKTGNNVNLQYNGRPRVGDVDGYQFWKSSYYDGSFEKMVGFIPLDGELEAAIQLPYIEAKPLTAYSVSISLYVENNTNDYGIWIKEIRNDDTHIYKVLFDYNEEKGRFIKNATFTTGDNVVGFYVEVWSKERINWEELYVTFVDYVNVIEGYEIYPSVYIPHIGSLNSNDTTINDYGVTVRTNEGGFSRLNADGLTVYNGSGNRTAWFGENDSAFIESISTNELKCSTVVRINDDCPTDLYCAPSATGDGTGRNADNKANSITNALEWLRKEYGCYNYKKDIRIHLASGDYWGGATYIGGWTGSGMIRIIFDDKACLRDAITIEENTMSVSMEGLNSPWSYNKLENGYIIVGNINAITVRNTLLHIGGITIKRNGWEGNIGTWTNYDCQAIAAEHNASVYCANCDMIGFYNIARCERNSKVTIWNNRGHVYRLGHALTGGQIIVHGDTPLRNGSTHTESGGQKIENLGNQINSTFDPKPDEPYTAPEVTENWQQTESTFWAASLVSYPEGSGVSTSARSECWGQGRYSSYQAHRGFAAFDSTQVSNFCAGARNIRVYLTLTRLNTAHGVAGAVPVPKLKKRNGSFWSCGVAFARGDTKTIELPYDVYSWLTENRTTLLEMWAGTSNNDYSFYNNTSIRVVCEKNFA